MKDQWIKGLQWGAALWLAWTAASSIVDVVDGLHFEIYAQTMIPALGWTLALALRWTRWSRVGVAIGIAAHTYAALAYDPPSIERVDTLIDGVRSQSYLDLMSLLTKLVPACLLVIPLLFMAPERPRRAAALALVGRWDEAARELLGIRWVLVAAGVLVLHNAFPEALRWWRISIDGRVHFNGWYIARQLVACALLFGAAAVKTPLGRRVVSGCP
jgi:hypothetical protein